MKGVSILEMMLVLLVISSIMLHYFRQQSDSQTNRRKVQLKQSIYILSDALNQYFYENCQKQDFPQRFLTIQDLVDKYQVLTKKDKKLLIDPFGEGKADKDFGLSVDKIKQDDKHEKYLLSISAKFKNLQEKKDKKALYWMARLLSANQVDLDHYLLLWSRYPQYSLPKPIDSGLWIADTGLQAFSRQFSQPTHIGNCVRPIKVATLVGYME